MQYMQKIKYCITVSKSIPKNKKIGTMKLRNAVFLIIEKLSKLNKICRC